jgi:nucleoid DNA-binding protein
MLAKGRGKGAVTGVVNPNAPKTNWITKKAADIVEPVAETITSKVPERGRITVGGKGPMEIVRERQAMPGYGVKAPPGILNPYRHVGTMRGRQTQFKGGGIAKRGTGVALKHGGRVKSMGIAKRGGGIAKK